MVTPDTGAATQFIAGHALGQQEVTAIVEVVQQRPLPMFLERVAEARPAQLGLLHQRGE